VNNKIKVRLISSFAGLIFSACQMTMPAAPEENTLLDGHIEGLSNEQQRQFLLGDEAFAETFTSESGVGPTFVATSCISCHGGDGKGHPSTSLTRFGQDTPGQNTFLDKGGPQLQNRAIPGYQPENLPPNSSPSIFLPPAVTGLGFLDAVSDADLMALEDSLDTDGDGISGKANWVIPQDYVNLRPNSIAHPNFANRYIGRVGKKAAAYDVLVQTANAYNQDMGVTSSLEPIDPYTGLEVEQDVDLNTIREVVFYLKTLKAPLRRDEDDANVILGEKIFEQIECAKCHTPTMTTGESSISALANKEFHPYTDLLLHDMGPSLDDNYTEGNAETAEWRTPVLWGLGLSKDSQGGSYFLLHDGRATSIEDAIQMHGGEAANASNLYGGLSTEDKERLIKFLESL
tara:strand:+ start:655 stop:1860 length:1206 start_codon:yes stop_codon:yes gene_type:complete